MTRDAREVGNGVKERWNDQHLPSEFEQQVSETCNRDEDTPRRVHAVNPPFSHFPTACEVSGILLTRYILAESRARRKPSLPFASESGPAKRFVSGPKGS